MDLFLPCLLLGSIGGSLNPAALQNSWHLVASGAFSTVLSNAIASLFGRLLVRREARPMFRPAQMAIAFPDSLVFPLLLLDALCEQSIIRRYRRRIAACFFLSGSSLSPKLVLAKAGSRSACWYAVVGN